MTWVAWVFIALIMASGAIFEGIANMESPTADSNTAASALNSMQTEGRVILIDDATLEAGPLNTGAGLPSVLSPDTWVEIFNVLTFNWSFLTGHWKMVQYIFQAIGGALVVYSAWRMATSLLGAVRGA